MKTEFLKALLPDISKEAIDAIMVENGKDIEKHKSIAEAAQQQTAELTNQISQRDADIAALKKIDADGLQAKLDSLQTQYDAERAAWKEKEQKRTYQDRCNAFFSDVKFSDDYARRGILAEFDEKGFAYDDAAKTFIGAKEWLDGIKTSSPSSFVGENLRPEIVRPTNSDAPTHLTKDAFEKMGYLSRLSLKNENPALYEQLKNN